MSTDHDDHCGVMRSIAAAITGLVRRGIDLGRGLSAWAPHDDDTTAPGVPE
jgi:hypothetical protein